MKTHCKQANENKKLKRLNGKRVKVKKRPNKHPVEILRPAVVVTAVSTTTTTTTKTRPSQRLVIQWIPLGLFFLSTQHGTDRGVSPLTGTR